MNDTREWTFKQIPAPSQVVVGFEKTEPRQESSINGLIYMYAKRRRYGLDGAGFLDVIAAKIPTREEKIDHAGVSDEEGEGEVQVPENFDDIPEPEDVKLHEEGARPRKREVQYHGTVAIKLEGEKWEWFFEKIDDSYKTLPSVAGTSLVGRTTSLCTEFIILVAPETPGSRLFFSTTSFLPATPLPGRRWRPAKAIIWTPPRKQARPSTR